MFHNDIRNVDERGENSWKRQGSIAFKMQTANGSPPLSVEQEIVGIIGYGHIGKSREVSKFEQELSSYKANALKLSARP